MAIFKCKMCGGDIDVAQGKTVGECQYCGTTQTLPKMDDESRLNLYARANHFRRNNEYDKAIGLYERILEQDNTDAEAYWSLVLCKYGIVYVEDPATHKQIPTVNRAQFTSVVADENYKAALQYADSLQKAIYQQEAKYIDEIQKGILAISQNEEPFDVFICYKETDNNGRRTHDSVLANDLYHQLTQEGFKVFFSRITLEDKLGTAYEPYIFAALNSAKVMVVLGTRPEYFNAVWVKNEWSRYLSLVKNSKGQKILIPAYKDMDPYDLPEEFSHLQAQDMSKLGFMQDLIRGIKKLVVQDTATTHTVKETVVVSGASGEIAPLLKRGYIYLEDQDWEKAFEYFERVLDMDPECVDAYLGKLMVDLRVRNQTEMRDCSYPFDDNPNYAKILRYGDSKLVDEIKEYINFIKERNEQQRLEALYQQASALMSRRTVSSLNQAAEIFVSIKYYKDSASLAEECPELVQEVSYNEAVTRMKSATTESHYFAAQSAFLSLKSYKDSEALAKKCAELANESRRKAIYTKAFSLLQNSSSIKDIESAQITFSNIKDYKDSAELIEQCRTKIAKLKETEEKLRQEEAKLKFRKKRIIAVISVVFIICFIALMASIANFNDDHGFEYIQNEDGTYSISGVENKLSNSLVLPEQYKGEAVTGIDGFSFNDCPNLTSITIPSSVKIIDDYAFSDCTSLTSISIPNSVTYIGAGAFSNCTSLTSITIPSSVKIIDDYAFSGCTSLTSISIPNSVTYIGAGAFSNCDSLTSVTIPNSVESLGDGVFAACDNLTSVTLSNKITEIPYSTFTGCKRLSSITIPNSVTNIERWAFSSCESLSKIIIPTSLTYIELWAFEDCTSLTNVYYRGTQEQWEEIIGSYRITDATSNTTIRYNYTGN